MRSLIASYRRLCNLIRHPKVEREIDRELSFHIAERIDELVASGMSEEEARRTAARQFGNYSLQKERVRDVKTAKWVESFTQDLRYAVRTYRRSPAVTLVVIVSLALGIGANVAVFTLLDTLLFRQLPVLRPDELVSVGWSNKSETEEGGLVSFPIYRDLRDKQNVFSDMFASGFLVNNFQSGTRVTTYSDSGQATDLDNVLVGTVTASYFSVLGLQPAIGRFFTHEDDEIPGSSQTTGSVVVLSDSLWERQFGRDPKVLGETVLIGRSRCRIVGVAPHGFGGITVGSATDAWVPVVPFTESSGLESRTSAVLEYVGRLKPGVGKDQAEAAMTLLYRQLLVAEARVRGVDNNSIQLTTAQAGTDSGLRSTYTMPLWIGMGIVLLVHLIACANVANLLLARSAARRSEIDIRLAIGCSRARLIRQLLTESVILSILGAAAGVVVAYGGTFSLVRMIDSGLQLHLGPDWRILTFLATIGILTGLGFGLVPALRATRRGLVPSRSGRQGLGRAAVTLQVALSLLLVIGAGLLIQTIYNLQRLDKGFRTDDAILFELADTRPQPKTDAPLIQLARDVPARIQQVSGVTATGASAPLSIFSSGSEVTIPLLIPDYGKETVWPRYLVVSPGYLEVLAIKLFQGRGIEESDTENAPLVAVINESMARRFFPDRAIGKIMHVSPAPSRRGPPIRVVGVVHDSKYNSLREQETRPMVYLPFSQSPMQLQSLLVQTREPLSSIVPSVRQALLEVSKDLMVRRAVTLSDKVAQSFNAERLIMRLSVYFGVLALLLACIGLYGTMSYAATRRIREIGIRIALGATRKSVLRLVLRDSFVVIVAGVLIGLAMAWAATRLIASYLYGVTANDETTFVLATLLLCATVGLAAFIPARHAARVAPTIALRHD